MSFRSLEGMSADLENATGSELQACGGAICYFLVCFSRTDYVGFLLSSLYNEKDIFLIHCDKKGPQDLQSYVQHLNDTYPNIVKLRSRDYSWAGYSHVEISLDTISMALNLPTFWTHFVFLSEQHLPLKSPEGIRDYLKTRKSMAAMRCTVEMVGGEKADIENRLYASYRELPGVGSFAVGPSDRIHAGLASTYHGSNWIVYHRDHCRILAEAEKNGDFHAFLDVVHAEEMAMPSILSPWQHEIESDDPTLVATPNAGNGYSLEMDEELFRSAIGTHYLFIRKRTNTLAPFVLDYIMMNNFVPSIHPAPNQPRTISKLVKMLRPHPTHKYVGYIKAHLARGETGLQISQFDPEHGSSPQLHFCIAITTLQSKLSVRILSENLLDFKVLLVDDEHIYGGVFEAPFTVGDFFYSTLRVRIFDLFGKREILPLGVTNAGFLTIQPDDSLDLLGETIDEFLHAARRHFYRPSGHAAVACPYSAQDGVSRMAHERLNRIGRISQATSYLEIGIANGENFFNIDIKNKTAVDPAFLFDFEAKRDAQTSFCQMTSDSFFGQYKGSAFDLIYLDGLHTYDQTLRDFLGSLSVAHSKTIWLIDDTRPNDNFSALPDQQRCYSLRKKTGNDDWAWMGDVFKVVYFIAIAMKNYQYRTFTGRGQTIVWHDPSCFDHMPNLKIGDIPSLTFDDYLETHEAIFNLHDDERIFAELREFLER